MKEGGREEEIGEGVGELAQECVEEVREGGEEGGREEEIGEGVGGWHRSVWGR